MDLSFYNLTMFIDGKVPMTNGLALPRQKLNRASSVQFSYVALYAP